MHGVKLKRQDVDRAHKAAVRVVKERYTRARMAAQTERESERAERIRAKEQAREEKRRQQEEKAEQELQREEKTRALLSRLRQETVLVGDILDLTGLAAIVGEDMARAAATYRVPGL